jgi:hypothetical protein
MDEYGRDLMVIKACGESRVNDVVECSKDIYIEY